MGFEGFPSGMIAFYDELGRNNERAWWQANLERYRRDVDEPMDRLVGELEEVFGPIKRFRPYRDVRFSADKRPYQEHSSFAASRPGGALYAQFGASGVMIAAGRWQPSPAELRRFRELVDDSRTASDVEAELAERAEDGLLPDEASRLKTAPRGFPRDHPRLDLLRLTRLSISTHLPPGPWLESTEALDTVTRLWRSADRWNEWLADAVPPDLESTAHEARPSRSRH